MLKILSKADAKLRAFFIDKCYIEAGSDEVKTVSCDYLQNDTIDMLWNGLKFSKILDSNWDKYIVEWGFMSED